MSMSKGKFKYKYHPKDIQTIRDRLEEAFECDGSVFIFIGTAKPEGDGLKITDAYQQICPECVVQNVDKMVRDAQKIGLLAYHGRCNLN